MGAVGGCNLKEVARGPKRGGQRSRSEAVAVVQGKSDEGLDLGVGLENGEKE